MERGILYLPTLAEDASYCEAAVITEGGKMLAWEEGEPRIAIELAAHRACIRYHALTGQPLELLILRKHDDTPLLLEKAMVKFNAMKNSEIVEIGSGATLDAMKSGRPLRPRTRVIKTMGDKSTDQDIDAALDAVTVPSGIDDED